MDNTTYTEPQSARLPQTQPDPQAATQPQEPQVVYVERKKNGLATAALVLGIIGLALSWIPAVNMVAIVLAVIAIGLGIAGLIMGGKRGGRIKAGIGTALAVATIVITALVNVAFVEAVDDAFDATDDVAIELSTVTTDELGFEEVELTVTNTSDEAQTFWVTVAAESADGSVQYDTTSVITSDLQPGQSATETAVFIEDIPADATIVVTDVL